MPQSASRHQSTSVRRGRTDVRQANTVGFHILRTESGSGRGGANRTTVACVWVAGCECEWGYVVK